ncbi:MAG: hypothetical protein V3T82_07955 [Nitrospinaceae bacterium]
MEELTRAYKDFASTKSGQIVLNDLLQYVGMGGDIYEDGNPHGTSRNAGMYRVGLRILNFIGSDVNQYVVAERQMKDEHKKHEETREEQAGINRGEGTAITGNDGKQAIL